MYKYDVYVEVDGGIVEETVWAENAEAAVEMFVEAGAPDEIFQGETVLSAWAERNVMDDWRAEKASAVANARRNNPALTAQAYGV